MRIEVVIKSGSKKEEVVCLAPGHYKVSVRQRPVEGKANEALLEALAEHFDAARSKVILEKGIKSRTKRVEILGR